jgi:hypothetical protein
MHFIKNAIILLLTSFVTTTLRAQTNIYDSDTDMFWKTFDKQNTKVNNQELSWVVHFSVLRRPVASVYLSWVVSLSLPFFPYLISCHPFNMKAQLANPDTSH